MSNQKQMRKDTHFILFMSDLVDELYLGGRIRTSETYSTTLNSFLRFLDRRSLPFKEVTPELIERYELWLAASGITRNSSSFYMRILRAVYNRAVNAGLTRDRRPFRNVYTGVDKTMKRALPVKVLKHLRGLALDGEPKLQYARDLFLFSFYTRGMSFIDMAYLKKTDLRAGFLQYARHKTGQVLTIRWEPCMQEIIDRYPPNPTEYLLPIITRSHIPARTQYKNRIIEVNAGLKALSERVHAPFPITTYSARHSWASIAYSHEVPMAVISEALGHDSEKTTRIYLASLSNSKIDRANKKIIKLL